MYANMYTNMNDTMPPIFEYTEDQQQPTTQQHDVWTYDHLVSGISKPSVEFITRRLTMTAAFPSQGPDPWTVAPVYQQPLQQPFQQPRLSVSTQRSSVSDPRTSSASDFSGWQRASMASTTSSWSNVSDHLFLNRGRVPSAVIVRRQPRRRNRLTSVTQVEADIQKAPSIKGERPLRYMCITDSTKSAITKRTTVLVHFLR
jgi:hypothetical protein